MRSLGQSRSNHLESRLQNHYEQGLDLGGGGGGGGSCRKPGKLGQGRRIVCFGASDDRLLGSRARLVGFLTVCPAEAPKGILVQRTTHLGRTG